MLLPSDGVQGNRTANSFVHQYQCGVYVLPHTYSNSVLALSVNLSFSKENRKIMNSDTELYLCYQYIRFPLLRISCSKTLYFICLQEILCEFMTEFTGFSTRGKTFHMC